MGSQKCSLLRLLLAALCWSMKKLDSTGWEKSGSIQWRGREQESLKVKPQEHGAPGDRVTLSPGVRQNRVAWKAQGNGRPEEQARSRSLIQAALYPETELGT